MLQATVRRLAFLFDRAKQALVFRGELESGYAFEVAFPIGHVAVTFEREAAALGYAAGPLLGGDYVTVDGFLGAVEVMHSREVGKLGREADLAGPLDRAKAMQAELLALSKQPGMTREKLMARYNQLKSGIFTSGVLDKAAKSVSTVASSAYNATIKKVGQQAVKYARQGVQAVGKAGLAIARSKLVGQALAGAAVVFPAVGAPALAAWGAANRAASAYDAASKGVASARAAVSTISSNAKALTGSSAPTARMTLAGLRSVPVFARA